MCVWLWFFCLSVFSYLFPTFYSKISSVFLYISTLKESKGHLVFLSVLFSCCVWYFRRWLSPTLYQTTATFVLGDLPPYVESLHRFPSESPFINLPSPLPRLSSPLPPLRTLRDRIETALQCLCRRLHLCLVPHLRVLPVCPCWLPCLLSMSILMLQWTVGQLVWWHQWVICCSVIDCHWFAHRRVTEHTVSQFDYYLSRLEIVFQDVPGKPDPRQTDRMKVFHTWTTMCMGSVFASMKDCWWLFWYFLSMPVYEVGVGVMFSLAWVELWLYYYGFLS